MRGVLGLALAVLLASVAGAEEVIRFDAPVSDADFHRAVGCGAAPGGTCSEPFRKWGPRNRRDLRVAVLPADPGYPPAKAQLVDRAVDSAIAALNGAGAGLRLRRVAPDERPRIRISRVNIFEGDFTQDVPGFPDGMEVGVGQFQYYYTDTTIERAAILITADIDSTHIRSVVLEELIQSLGLLNDVSGRGYYGRSIFDDDSNLVTTIKGQDLAILRLHYPPT